jgi:hypothetical protein
MDHPNLVAEPIVRARTRKRLALSKVSGTLVFLGRFIAPIYLRVALSFRGAEILHPRAVVRAMEDFQQKRTRLIVAFRHAYGDEAQLMFHVFENLLPRYAKRLHTPIKRGFSIRPVHDYAVALWGDAVIRFILPRVGALPVYHSRLDSESLNNIRSVMRDGPNPLGIAPEGQISYHAETLPRIEQGTVRMGFWCARDLEKAGRPEHVEILPLSIHYRCDVRDAKKIRKMLTGLEAVCGLTGPADGGAEEALEEMLRRIDRIESCLLTLTEAHYQSAYGYSPAAPAEEPGDSDARHERWMALLPFAITVAERILGIEPQSADTVQRMYRVRQVGWDRVYPDNPVEALNTLTAALADRCAGEAWYAMRHMELVDVMGYHDAGYLTASNLSFDRIVETVLTLWDLAGRLRGGNITNRPNTIRKHAFIVPGERIDLTEQLPAYHDNARQTVQTLTETLVGRFETCIEVYRSETK